MDPLPKAPKVTPAKVAEAAKPVANTATQPAVEVKKESVNEQK
jgi:hypothetical protein